MSGGDPLVPVAPFELACVAIVALTLFVRTRALAPDEDALRDVALPFGALAVAGWLGEHTMVTWYGFYSYADAWHARVGGVPVLVPLIWPLVVLSAGDVSKVLAPRAGLLRALLAGALVAFDASLVEVIAVHAGLWSWAEPGHLGVPLVGILGWGFFAAGAHAWLDRVRGAARGAVMVVAPLMAHLGVLASWWGLFRHSLRGALGDGSVFAVAILGGLLAVGGAAQRTRGRVLPPAVWAPRVVAALLFFGLLCLTPGVDVRLWVHAAAVAVPYLVITSWHSRRGQSQMLGESPKRSHTAFPAR
jgi:hypothetical protein